MKTHPLLSKHGEFDAGDTHWAAPQASVRVAMPGSRGQSATLTLAKAPGLQGRGASSRHQRVVRELALVDRHVGAYTVGAPIVLSGRCTGRSARCSGNRIHDPCCAADLGPEGDAGAMGSVRDVFCSAHSVRNPTCGVLNSAFGVRNSARRRPRPQNDGGAPPRGGAQQIRSGRQDFAPVSARHRPLVQAACAAVRVAAYRSRYAVLIEIDPDLLQTGRAG